MRIHGVRSRSETRLTHSGKSRSSDIATSPRHADVAVVDDLERIEDVAAAMITPAKSFR
jgi:hypothetical protein